MPRKRLRLPLLETWGFLILIALSASSTSAQFSVQIVRDVAQAVPEPASLYQGRARVRSPELAGSTYFYAHDGIHGTELWLSDGTAAGTRMVRDLCPGLCGSNGSFLVESLARLGNRILFTADDGVHGHELWSTDGTPGGTHLLLDLRPGLASSRPSHFRVVGSRMYFMANTPSGWRAWVTDGTPSGTQPLLPAVTFVAGVELAGRFVFAGSVGNTAGLFSTDGTPAGTALLLAGSVHCGTLELGAPCPFLVAAGKLYFVRWQSGQYRLWVTDGTAGGTIPIPQVVEPQAAEACGGSVYLLARSSSASTQSIWRTQGTPATTQEIASPPPIWPTLGCAHSRLLFVADDPVHGREPWRIDGSTASLLVDLRVGPSGSFDGTDLETYTWTHSGPRIQSFGNQSLLFADDGIHGLEPWITDGTPAGTTLLLDTNPGSGSFGGFPLEALPGQSAVGAVRLFFERAADRTSRLWRSDGTPAGTELVTSLETATSILPADLGSELFSWPRSYCFAPFGRGIAFGGQDDGHGWELWTTDGTVAGTVPFDLVPGPGSSRPSFCRPIQDRLLVFHAPTDLDPPSRLSALDRSTQTIGFLADAVPSSAVWDGVDSVAYRNPSAFLAVGGLRKTDGTPGGTIPIPTPDALPSGGITRVADDLYVVGEGGLWHLNPDTDALSLISDAAQLRPLSAANWGVVGRGGGNEAWRSDGTAAGTYAFHELPGTAGALDHPLSNLLFDPREALLLPIGSLVFYAPLEANGDRELWVYDGTNASLVADLFPGPYPSLPQQLTRVGSTLFFVAEHPTAGRELWVYEPGGPPPSLVSDLVPGAASSLPQSLSAVREELWFSAWTPSRGREPWRARRNGAGWTVEPVADIAPGPMSSNPLLFVPSGRWVFTLAQDGLRGFEVWRIRDLSLLFADDFETSALAQWSTTLP